jgi:hypothetical protein
MFKAGYPRISRHSRWCRGKSYLLILIVHNRLLWELLWKIAEFWIIGHWWSIYSVLLHLIHSIILSPQLVFHEEPRYFFIRHLCCLVHYFLILLIYLRLFRHVICIVLYIMLSMTLRKSLTVIIYLTLHLLFLAILGFFLLLLRLSLLITIFNALIKQLLIDHDDLLNGLVTVPLLLTRIINY